MYTWTKCTLLTGWTIVLLLCLGCQCRRCEAQTPDLSDGVDVYLLAGQSNMTGQAATDDEFTPVSNILNWDITNATWEVASDPLRSTQTHKGLALAFGNYLRDNNYLDRSIGFVQCAINGSSITEWEKGDANYNYAINSASAAVAAVGESELAGILWQQGEADEFDTDIIADYETTAALMFANIRADLSAPKALVLVGEIGDFRPGFVELVNTAIQTIPDAVDYCGWVSADGLTDLGDGGHFDGASLTTYGERFGAAWAALPEHSVSGILAMRW